MKLSNLDEFEQKLLLYTVGIVIATIIFVCFVFFSEVNPVFMFIYAISVFSMILSILLAWSNARYVELNDEEIKFSLYGKEYKYELTEIIKMKTIGQKIQLTFKDGKHTLFPGLDTDIGKQILNIQINEATPK